jgi:hypothetical protein
MTTTITPTSRRSDYSLDVYVDGLWIASASNYHTADACLAGSPPFDDEPDPGPEGPGVPGDERPRSLYERMVAQCQAELDARFGLAERLVLDVEFAPLGFPV